MHSQTTLYDEKLPFFMGEIRYGEAVEGVDVYRYDTIDRSKSNVSLAPRQMPIYDIRSKLGDLSYEKTGFCLQKHISQFAYLGLSAEVNSEMYLQNLRGCYLNEMDQFIRQLSGSPFVIPQPTGFFVRHGHKSPVRTPNRPAALPHNDFSLQTATEMAKRLQELYLPGKDIRDFAIYQTWRAISPPPQDNIFAFCEYPAVTREDFRTVKSIMGPDEIPSNVYYMEMAQHSPRHKWYYFDNLSPDEVIIFKGWDSRAPYSILHSSVNKSVANANPRVSLESRHYVFFE